MDSSGATHVVNYYRKFYKILIHYLKDSISIAEKDTLTVMAYSCPSTNGGVVYQARGLYGVVFNTVTIFSDDVCNPGGEGRPGKHGNNNNAGNPYVPAIETALSQSQIYSLLPNPNNGDMFLMQKVRDENAVSAVVINAEGQSVYKKQMWFSGNISPINLQYLSPGLYLMVLRDAGGSSYTIKFIVN